MGSTQRYRVANRIAGPCGVPKKMILLHMGDAVHRVKWCTGHGGLAKPPARTGVPQNLGKEAI